MATWCKELTHWKRPWCWERLMTRGEGGNRGWSGWMASSTQWIWVWVSSGMMDRVMDREAWCASPQGGKESDMTEWLKWTEIKSLLKILLIDFIYKEAIRFSSLIKTELNFILPISIINFRYTFSYFLQVISMQEMKCNASRIKNPQKFMTSLTFKGKEGSKKDWSHCHLYM